MLYTENSLPNIHYRPSSSSSPFLASLTSLGTYSTHLKNRNPAATSHSTKSFKPIKIIRKETKKQTQNDVCMAAASGDIDWLKKTLKVSEEMPFDKNVIFYLKSIKSISFYKLN
jgi:hypothetical protein